MFLLASLLLCQIDDSCNVVGSSMGRATHTYSISCVNQKNQKQLEYVEGSTSAEFLDLVTREPIEKCTVEPAKMKKLIQEFNEQKQAIEKPQCLLGHWHGQLTFRAGQVTGRCSLSMNKDLSEKFEKATGLSPRYQCEKDYFLIEPTKDGTAIYKPEGKTWKLECRAAMETGKEDQTDWKNPPDYFKPEEPTVLPKTK